MRVNCVVDVHYILIRFYEDVNLWIFFLNDIMILDLILIYTCGKKYYNKQFNSFFDSYHRDFCNVYNLLRRNKLE